MVLYMQAKGPQLGQGAVVQATAGMLASRSDTISSQMPTWQQDDGPLSLLSLSNTKP